MLTIPVRLGERIRSYRLARGLGQTELGARIDMDHDRVSALERGIRKPCLEEVDRLAAGLRIRRERLLVGTDWGLDNRERLRQTRRDLVFRFAGDVLVGRDDYSAPRDRDFRVRVRAARRTWPAIMRELDTRIESRDDYDHVRLLLRDVPCDSADEALVVLKTVAGGRPVTTVAPLHLGFDRHFVVDPSSGRGVGHCHVPTLVLPFRRFECVIIPQVSLKTADDVFTVDFLAGCRVRRRVDWAVVEMDGHGHAAWRDAERDAALHMPVLRFGPAAAAEDTFMDHLEERLADAIALDVPKLAA